MSVTVAATGEHALIERLRLKAGVAPHWVTLGIGDDAAILQPARGTLDVVSTDSLVEGVHFRRDWTPASAIGHKAIASSLSDLAAMGATPRACLLSLALPSDLPLDDFDALIDGYLAVAARAGAPLVGGNLTRSPSPMIVDTTVIGAVPRRRWLSRQGGRAGDELYVTGSIGAATTGLALLSAGLNRTAASAVEAECVARYERPEARLRCGRVVARSRGASACMDLSDGLADAARQIAASSRLGVVIEADAVPVHPGTTARAATEGGDAVAIAMNGGEDYELLFAVPRRRRSRFFGAIRRCPDVTVTRLGRLIAEPGAWLERAGLREPLGRGFVHF